MSVPSPLRTIADVVPWRGLRSPNLRRIFAYVRPEWRLLALTGFFAVLYLPFAYFEPLIVKYLIDRVLLGHEPKLFLRIAGLTFGFFLVYGLIEFVSAYFVLRLARRLHAAIKREQLGRILAKGLNFHRSTASGGLLYCFFNDSAQIGTLLSLGMSNAVLGFVLVIVRSVILWRMAPWLLVIFYAVVPFEALVMVRVMQRTREFQIDLKRIDEDLSARIESLLRGVLTVKAFGFAGPLAGLWNERFNERLGIDFQNMMWQKAGALVIGNIHLVGSFAVLFLGASMVDAGTLTLGTLLAFLTVSGRLAPGVHGLISFVVGIQETLVGIERFYRLHDLPDEAREFVQRSGAAAQNGTRALALADFDVVALRNVTVDYATARIRVPCDFRLERGRRYIWHGPNGAGKTSLGLALAGLVPHGRGGIVCRDTPLADFPLASLREHVLYVGSEPFWPERTLAENFTNGASAGPPDPARLAEALRVSEADAIVQSLPLGMETVLTTKGHILSQGEGQRLFLALAVYRRPSILILDETLSHVSTRVIERTIDRLVALPGDTLVIYVTHSAELAPRFQGEVRFQSRV